MLRPDSGGYTYQAIDSEATKEVCRRGLPAHGPQCERAVASELGCRKLIRGLFRRSRISRLNAV